MEDDYIETWEWFQPEYADGEDYLKLWEERLLGTQIVLQRERAVQDSSDIRGIQIRAQISTTIWYRQ